MQSVNKFQGKGVIISILFVTLTLAAALLGIDLGRFLWIGIFLFILLIGIYYSIWKTIKTIRENRD
jgi:hypothetical protein